MSMTFGEMHERVERIARLFKQHPNYAIEDIMTHQDHRALSAAVALAKEHAEKFKELPLPFALDADVS